MRSDKTNRKHSASCTVNIPELTKSGTSVEIEIHSDGKKIGTIKLGRGSLTWRGGKRQIEATISWSDFADWMDERCYGDHR